MFCPSCGTEGTGLKYCNRCGANLALPSSQPEIIEVNLTKPAVMIGIIVMFLTLGGFGLLIGGARALATVVQGNDPLMAMILFGMVIILTIDIILVRQLSKLINATLKTDSRKISAAPTQTPQLQPQTQQYFPAASVTENTTRFFESAAYRAPSDAPTTAKKLNE